MLKLAVKSGIPLIAVRTTDTMNAAYLIEGITGRKVTQVTSQQGFKPEKGSLYLMPGDIKPDLIPAMYVPMAQYESTCIFMNLKTIPEAVTDIGVLPTPKFMVKRFLSRIFFDVDTKTDDPLVEKIAPALGGFNLREISENIRMTQARDGDLTPEGIAKTRRMFMVPSRGLSMVNTELDGYLPDPRLHAIAQDEGMFLLRSEDARLRPRGLLADGVPGTGKTQGAKYLANVWGVPLFKLDGTVQHKYVGDSEGNLKQALQQVDQEAPCILLIDEVEKFVANPGADSGVKSGILGMLLWWMQEHESSVYVYLTCNSKRAIPPELYREGRVDTILQFVGLTLVEAIKFAWHYLSSFEDHGLTKKEVLDELKHIYALAEAEFGSGHAQVAHAKITSSIIALIKRKRLAIAKSASLSS